MLALLVALTACGQKGPLVRPAATQAFSQSFAGAPETLPSSLRTAA